MHEWEEFECSFHSNIINNAKCPPCWLFCHHPQISALLRSHHRQVTHSPFRSKKKVRWIIEHDRKRHEINCSISFYSGKKRAEHNGFKIIDLVDKRNSLNFEVYVGGTRKVYFAIDEAMEMVELEAREGEDCFGRFQNVFSGKIREVYE